MIHRKLTVWILTVVVIGSLAGCGNDATPTPSPSVDITPTVIATTVATPTSVADEVGITFVDAADDETFPTPDVARGMAEMAPTAVIVEGAFPYPTANSALDSDGDGFYTRSELEQAVRESYPAWKWPDAYHPTIDELFEIVSFTIYDPDSTHEVPGELAWIGNIHQCAWQQNWIDAFGAGDQEEMNRSMQELRGTVLNNPLNVYVATIYAEMYDLAELGDPSKLINAQSQCVGFNQWIKNRGAAPQWVMIGAARELDRV